MGPKKRNYRSWKEEDMELALQAVNERMSICKASKEFGVPKQTISDRRNQRWKTSTPGRPTELSVDEESALIDYIKFMATIAQPLTVPGIKAFPDKLDRGRSRMANQTVMDQHFDLLKNTLVELDILDKPERIYNCDESGMAMDKMTSKVIVQRKSKQAYSESKGNRDHITVHVCVSAARQPLPPFIIFEKAYPSGPYSRSGPDNACYACSPNGYMDIELFKLWITKQFIPETAHVRKPILLILDGHGSHMDIDMIDILVENDIHLYCLPPHTTNILQPLDLAVFRPLKTRFSNITDMVKLASLGSANPLSVTKKNFTALFKVAFEDAMSIGTIKNGFRKCGIYPFNPDAIDKKRLMPPSLGYQAATNKDNASPLASPTAPSPLPSSSTIPASTTGASTPSTEFIGSSNPSSPAALNSLTSLPGESKSVTPKNPLVDAGIIPASLVDCFITPETTPKAKKENNVRVTTEARLLTSEEHRALFREKLEKKR